MKLVAVLILTITAFPAFAKAEPIMFMLNMNYSSNELAAVKETAKKRNQAVVMVPPERLIPQAEELFAARDSLVKKIQATRPECPKGTPVSAGCWTISAVRTVVANYMTKGLEFKRNPEINDQFASEIEDLRRRTSALAAEEKKLGPIEDQVRNKVSELTAQGKRLDSVIISAHSNGSSLSGESSNRLSSSSISRLARDVPQLFKDPRHVLLLGCYNMTKIHHDRWRNSYFTNASLIGGFGKRAPLRTRPVSAKYIKDVLGAADELDKKLISNEDLDKNFLERVFKKLSSVSDTYSVIDYCKEIIEGKPDSFVLSCQEQWNDFKARSEIIQQEYLDLRNPTSDPPTDVDGNDLRDFYTDAQVMCDAKDAPQIPRNQVARAEAYRVAMREMAIRVVYWWNVQQNYGTYFSREISGLSKALSAAGIRVKVPELDGTTGRIEFVKKYLQIENAIEDAKNSRELTESQRRALRQAESQFVYLKPLYLLGGEDSEADSELTAESTLANGGIPFFWHDVGVVNGPRGSQ